jgi:hypothetical protein
MNSLLPLKLLLDSLFIFFALNLLLILVLLEREDALELLKAARVHALGQADLQGGLLWLEGTQLLFELI